MRLLRLILIINIIGFSMSLWAQEAPMGSSVEPKKKEKKSLESLKGTLTGKIVWSTSRSNSKHDIWIMQADGTDKKQLTKGDHVDWFARWSPDGSKVLFTRSKMGWVPETDAKYFDKWDLWTIMADGTDEKKVVEKACWGTWGKDGETVVFARGSKAFTKNLTSGDETMLLDGSESLKKGAIIQQPQLSPNGKYLAATIRGTRRETGIWHLEKKEWYTTGKGCQINWFPGSDKIYRMNPTGNGGTAAPSEVLHIELNDGKPSQKLGKFKIPKNLKLMDLPGKRSHEYFPKFEPKGEWMVWCATAKGHDHDLYDYEMFIWKKGTDKKKGFTRLTFHSGNDRWPDLFLTN